MAVLIGEHGQGLALLGHPLVVVAGLGRAIAASGDDAAGRGGPLPLASFGRSSAVPAAIGIGHQVQAPGAQVHALAGKPRLALVGHAVVVVVLEQNTLDGARLALEQGAVVVGAVTAGAQVVGFDARGQRRRADGSAHRDGRRGKHRGEGHGRARRVGGRGLGSHIRLRLGERLVARQQAQILVVVVRGAAIDEVAEHRAVVAAVQQHVHFVGAHQIRVHVDEVRVLGEVVALLVLSDHPGALLVAGVGIAHAVAVDDLRAHAGGPAGIHILLGGRALGGQILEAVDAVALLAVGGDLRGGIGHVLRVVAPHRGRAGIIGIPVGAVQVVAGRIGPLRVALPTALAIGQVALQSDTAAVDAVLVVPFFQGLHAVVVRVVPEDAHDVLGRRR